MTPLVANLLVLGLLGLAGWLSATDPDLYYRIVQEDEIVEWASFWAFALAALAHARLARHGSARGIAGLWFPAGVAAFCLFVALEEISWGQRLVGFRPPGYFLEHNFQQELNLHNVVPTAGRTLALQAVIVGYGLALPLLGRASALRTRLDRLAVRLPPAGLAPAFLALSVAYAVYPWEFTGEWVELGLGLGFLLAALPEASPNLPARRRLAGALTAPAAVAVLAALSAAVAHRAASGSPERVAAARTEAAALRRDLQRDGVRSGCGLHKRLYTWVRETGVEPLAAGDFAALTGRGLPEDRARFFLDPWNSPWWVRDSCDTARGLRVVLVYSFGPDRRRDSDGWRVRGDDVGVVVRREIREAPRP